MATSRLCSVDGCGKAHTARGYCSQHYDAWRKRGAPDPSPNVRGTCTIPGCDRPHRGHGYCSRHYERWRAHGDPLKGRVSNGGATEYYREVVLAYRGEDCLIWPFGKTPAGYGKVWDGSRMQIVSRMVCSEVNGPPPSESYQAAHSCGRGHLGCVAPTHVRWATREENERDKIAHGSIRTGERHPMAKLSAEDVCQIRKDDRPQWQIATSYNVTQTTISDIKTGRKWARGL